MGETEGIMAAWLDRTFHDEYGCKKEFNFYWIQLLKASAMGILKGVTRQQMDLIDGPGLLEWFQQNLGSSTHVRIAVAFWGKGAAEQLVLGKNRQDTKIVCNLRMGGTNPREIETFRRKSGVEVRHSDTLHAKIYLLDKGGVVGSSNVSANGLSFQGQECGGWTEANVVFSDRSLYEATEAKFNEIWQLAKPVEDQDLKDAYEAWSRRRRRNVPIRNGARSKLADGP